jgi:hypothetical protein
MATVYALVDPRDHEIRYIGVTKNALHPRLSSHVRTAQSSRRGSTHKNDWIRKLLRTGYTPQIIEIQSGLAVKDAFNAEIYWISHFKDQGACLTNTSTGGEGTTGVVPSAATRQKMRDAWANNPERKPWVTGRTHSSESRALIAAATRQQFSDPDQRERVSQAHKGKTITVEHRARVSAANTARWAAWRESGSQVSDETRSKLRAARAGKPGHAHSDESRQKMADARRAYWARKRGEL